MACWCSCSVAPSPASVLLPEVQHVLDQQLLNQLSARHMMPSQNAEENTDSFPADPSICSNTPLRRRADKEKGLASNKSHLHCPSSVPQQLNRNTPRERQQAEDNQGLRRAAKQQQHSSEIPLYNGRGSERSGFLLLGHLYYGVVPEKINSPAVPHPKPVPTYITKGHPASVSMSHQHGPSSK